MKQHDFSSIDDFRGTSLPFFTTHMELVRLQVSRPPVALLCSLHDSSVPVAPPGMSIAALCLPLLPDTSTSVRCAHHRYDWRNMIGATLDAWLAHRRRPLLPSALALALPRMTSGRVGSRHHLIGARICTAMKAFAYGKQ